MFVIFDTVIENPELKNLYVTWSVWLRRHILTCFQNIIFHQHFLFDQYHDKYKTLTF